MESSQRRRSARLQKIVDYTCKTPSPPHEDGTNVKECEEIGNVESSQKRTRGRPQKIVDNTCKTPSLPDTEDGECEEIGYVVSSQTRKRGRPLKIVDNTCKTPSLPEDGECEEIGYVESSQTRKRGRPRKIVDACKTPSPLPEDATIVEECEADGYGPLAIISLPYVPLAVDKNDTGLVKSHEEGKSVSPVQESEKSGNVEVSQPRKRGRPRKSPVITSIAPAPLSDNKKNANAKDETQIQATETEDAHGVAERRNAKHMDAEKVITGAPSDSFDEINTQTPTDNGDATVLSESEGQRLPFVKRSPSLWATIESMDVFQRIPQKPHFQPLKHVKENHREGLAFAHMITFASLVDKCCRLQWHDPRTTIDEISETLDDLRTHGFDVQPLQDRLNQLLSFKDEKENLDLRSSDISSQIVQQSTENREIDEEIKTIKTQISELEQKLSIAISRKESKNLEIAALRSQLDEVSVEVRRKHTVFQDLASKPL